MRMFLIGMTDIFLLLYLTAITNVQPGTVLTVEDFYKLNEMQQTLEQEKQAAEEALKEKLRRSQEEKEMLAAKLNEEKGRADEMKKTLVLSDAERQRINQDLKAKEDMLKAREQLLEDLNDQIAAKEADWKKMREGYKLALENRKAAAEEARRRAETLEVEAANAQRLADQMQEEADQAYATADMAEAVKDRAVQLKEEALREKEEAKRRAEEALAARQAAEEQKEKALEVAQTAQAQKSIVEQKARILAATIDEITQDGDTAYQENVRPQLQTLNVTWAREIAGDRTFYERELTLLPVKIDGEVMAVFPSRQIGFTGRSDRIPDSLSLKYGDRAITGARISEENGLIAVVLPGYEGPADEPHPAATPVNELMPVLLSLRNNGNVGMIDKIRGISDDYFIVNRDYIEPGEGNTIKFSVSGFRGTGLRAERAVRGDQLVDLNGCLIGIANTANHIIRVDSLNGWSGITF